MIQMSNTFKIKVYMKVLIQISIQISIKVQGYG